MITLISGLLVLRGLYFQGRDPRGIGIRFHRRKGEVQFAGIREVRQRVQEEVLQRQESKGEKTFRLVFSYDIQYTVHDS